MVNVHSCEILKHGSFILVSGQCNPSQSTSKDDVKHMHVVLDLEGNPVGGFCVCTAGLVYMYICLKISYKIMKRTGKSIAGQFHDFITYFSIAVTDKAVAM